MERLYGLVFAAKRMVKGAATFTSFALENGHTVMFSTGEKGFQRPIILEPSAP